MMCWAEQDCTLPLHKYRPHCGVGKIWGDPLGARRASLWPHYCGAPLCLPSVFYRALGKHGILSMSQRNTLTYPCFAKCFLGKALGKFEWKVCDSLLLNDFKKIMYAIRIMGNNNTWYWNIRILAKTTEENVRKAIVSHGILSHVY